MINFDPTGEWHITQAGSELVMVHSLCAKQYPRDSHSASFHYTTYKEKNIGMCFSCRAPVSSDLIKKAIFIGAVCR